MQYDMTGPMCRLPRDVKQGSQRLIFKDKYGLFYEQGLEVVIETNMSDEIHWVIRWLLSYAGL